jgi:hypothetical protein
MRCSIVKPGWQHTETHAQTSSIDLNLKLKQVEANSTSA